MTLSILSSSIGFFEGAPDVDAPAVVVGVA
jgi:hypothetical protein